MTSCGTIHSQFVVRNITKTKFYGSVNGTLSNKRMYLLKKNYRTSHYHSIVIRSVLPSLVPLITEVKSKYSQLLKERSSCVVLLWVYLFSTLRNNVFWGHISSDGQSRHVPNEGSCPIINRFDLDIPRRFHYRSSQLNWVKGPEGRDT